MFHTKVVEKIIIHMSCEFFSLEIRTFYELRWRNILEPGRPQITIWCLRIACRITKATSALLGYAILIAFPLQQWLHERASVLRYTYIACLVLTWHELKFPSRQKVGSGANNQLWCFIMILCFTHGRSNKVSLQSFSWELLDHPCYCLDMWPVRTLVNKVSLFSLPHVVSNLQLAVFACTEFDEVSEGVRVILPSACPQKSGNEKHKNSFSKSRFELGLPE
jgi:hypothetical protein